jgi:hypothetical protein
MTMTRTKTYFAAATIAVVALTSIAMGTAIARPSDLVAAKAATGRFHSLSVAKASGYGQPPAGVPLHECISNGAAGAMGFHFIKGSLLDTTLDPTKPEALVYAPDKNGKLKLAALEFVVFQAAWADARVNDPSLPVMPELFGQMFMPVNAAAGHGGNTVFDIPPFYMLHVWLWNSNPSGLFNPWNPSVSCAGATASAGSTTAAGAAVNATLAAADVARYACRIRGANA